MDTERVVEFIGKYGLNDKQKKALVVIILTKIREELTVIEKRREELNDEYNSLQELLR